MSALRSVQTGSVRVAGQELHGATDAVLTTARRKIGFVFQKHNLIGALTARQNVQMAVLIDRPANAVRRGGCPARPRRSPRPRA